MSHAPLPGLALLLVLLALSGGPAFAAEGAPAVPAQAPAAGEESVQSGQRNLLKQAFDGAMTCSALTALKADAAAGEAQQLWANRSFAFGMLAVRFYTDLTHEPLSNDELNDALNQYADAMTLMVEEELAPFEAGCGAKYADMDRLCAENGCVYPGAGETPAQP